MKQNKIPSFKPHNNTRASPSLSQQSTFQHSDNPRTLNLPPNKETKEKRPHTVVSPGSFLVCSMNLVLMCSRESGRTLMGRLVWYQSSVRYRQPRTASHHSRSSSVANMNVSENFSSIILLRNGFSFMIVFVRACYSFVICLITKIILKLLDFHFAMGVIDI